MVDDGAYEAFAKRNNNDEILSPVDGATLKCLFLENLSIWLNRNRNACDFRPLIRKVLLRDQEMRCSEEEEDDVEPDTINDYAFLLANYRSLEDVLFIWKKKSSSTMDVFMSLRQYYLVFCGVDETKEFLIKDGSKLATDALEWIVLCDNAGSFANLDDYIERMARDFDARDYVD